jgi:two-component system chemotaxis response regulator CheY
MIALIAEPPPGAASANTRLSIWSEESQPRPVSPNKRQARILYADDDASLRRAGQLILTREGYSVTTVPDGAEAFSALHLDCYDLLITDNNMPRLSGLGLITKLAEVLIEIPTIMVSGGVSDLMEAELRQIRLRGAVLAKPFSPEQLTRLPLFEGLHGVTHSNPRPVLKRSALHRPTGQFAI